MKWIRYAIVFVLLLVMFGVSQALGEKEIIFPEIMAVTLGALCMDRQPWKVGRVHMVVMMTLSACAGVAVVRYLPLPLVWQALMGFVFVALCLILTDTTMAPMISACILPMFLQTESLVYPVSVAVMVTAVVLTQKAMERSGVRAPEPAFVWRRPSRNRLLAWGAVFAPFALLGGAAIASGLVYLIVPPLIVTWIEGCFHDWTGKRLRIFGAVACCSCAGVLVRLGLAEGLHWPLIASGAVAVALVFGILALLRTPFPPACAIGLLPFLLPAEGLMRYPLYAATGCAAILLLARIWSPWIARLLSAEEGVPARSVSVGEVSHL